MSHKDAKYVHVREFQNILRKGKVALTITVTNEWPERGTSPVNWIKLRTRNTVKMDLFKSPLIISINDLFLESKTQVSKIVEKDKKCGSMYHCKNKSKKKHQ